MGPFFGILLGLIGRLRQAVTGVLPTRDDWIDDLQSFIDSQEDEDDDDPAPSAREILDLYFPLGSRGKPKKQLKVSVDGKGNSPILVAFITYWLTGVAPEFDNEIARDLLGRLDLGDGPAEKLENIVKDKQSFASGIVVGLQDFRPEWAPGLRLFDWPSVRSGFVTYTPISSSDVRGLYLIVREARGWGTYDEDSPATLVRDLLWVRAEPSDASLKPDPEFEGIGRYFSAFNSTVYRLATGAVAGDWHRFQGPPIKANPRGHLEMEIAAPALESVDALRPAFSLMSAHARGPESAGVWKALILRIDPSSEEWSDIDCIEPELEMFCKGDGALSDTDMVGLIQHLKERGVIGAFSEQDPGAAEATTFFHELLRTYHPDDYRERLKDRVRALVDGADDPIAALVENWHLIEPAQIILPPSDDARIPAEASEPARLALFGRSVLGVDQVAKRVDEFAARRSASVED
jgi:hypothetical protein